MPFDLVVRGGHVLDGTGRAAFRADVGVLDGRIAAVGTLPDEPAGTVVDAAGRYVAPGLIDAHVHGDGAVFSPDVQLAALAQGVTTFVGGQDGISYAPASPATLRFAGRYFAAVNGAHPLLDGGPVSVRELLDGYDGRIPLNMAYLVPHGTVRYEVMGGAARPAGEDELAAMLRLVEEGLDAGAAGVSTGLEYSPGRYAELPELVAVASAAGRRGLPYVSHLRGYEGRAAIGMAEATAIGRASGAPVHVSHYHGPAAELLGLVEAAADLDLSYDSYPYLRGNTILGMLVLPSWIPAEVDEALAVIAGRRAEVERDLPGDGWERLTLSHVPSARWAWTEGLTAAAAAERAGLGPAAFAVELLLATGLEAGCVVAQPPTNDEESVRALLRHPAQVGGSDGIYLGGHPHPRGWGAFARFLGVHTRELADWTWPEAIRHLSGATARRFGLTDRGELRAGAAADLFVFDPRTVADRAGYDAPRTTAAGVATVVVNGTVVLSGGALTGALPGRALRRSA